MFIVENLHIAGRHKDLVPATSFAVADGELYCHVTPTQEERTALALALSGRMKPDSGSASWGRNRKIEHLRRSSGLIDSPGINDPERHMKVEDVVTEDLALIPGHLRQRIGAKEWMQNNGFTDLADEWFDVLEPLPRLELLCLLALSDPSVDLLIVDSPDRHGSDSWFGYLESLISADDGPRCIVALVGNHPLGLL